MSKAIKKVVKTVTKKGPLGDLLLGGADKAADIQKKQIEQAEKASRLAMEQQANFDRQAQLLSSNQAGLTGANAATDTTKFDIGGTDAPDTILNDMRKRRGKATASSQLGIV